MGSSGSREIIHEKFKCDFDECKASFNTLDELIQHKKFPDPEEWERICPELEAVLKSSKKYQQNFVLSEWIGSDFLSSQHNELKRGKNSDFKCVFVWLVHSGPENLKKSRPKQLLKYNKSISRKI